MPVDMKNVEKQVKEIGEDVRLKLERLAQAEEELKVERMNKIFISDALSQAMEVIKAKHSDSFKYLDSEGNEITENQWEDALNIENLTPLEEVKLLFERLETLWHKLLQQGYEEFSLSGTPHLIESETGMVIGPFPGISPGIRSGGESSGASSGGGGGG